MQKNVFVGNLARPVQVSGGDERAYARFTLISNEYAGRDEYGQPRERSVALPFTAFRGKGDAIANNALTGDQLIVEYRIENNDYEKHGEMVYGFNFIVEDFTFGAPGKEKRDQFSSQAGA